MRKVYKKFTSKFTNNRKSLLIFMCKFYTYKKVNFCHFALYSQGEKSLLGCKFSQFVYQAVKLLFTRSLLGSLLNASN
ncbi:MAG TPA: hypothetical protein DDX84_04200 [Nitrospiraceae bacterium]|nr:hypothetical protein [Nitrospiraceae bacterium]